MNFDDYLSIKSNDTNESFLLKKCICSLVLTSPRPSISDIGLYYDSKYSPHLGIASNNGVFNSFFKKISYLWKFLLIKKYNLEKNVSLLDIGGGDGSLCLYLKNKFFKVHVYEKNQKCVDSINDKKLFATMNLTSLENNAYSILTLFHSLEHIHDIDELFTNINRISKDRARMIIAVPNIEASEIKFLAEKWIAWDVPRHLYHFNLLSLELLLDKYGWKIIKSKTMFQDTFFNIYMTLKSNFKLGFAIFPILLIYSIFIQLFFPNRRSSNLIVCQKK